MGTATGGLGGADSVPDCARPFTDGGLLRLPARLNLREQQQRGSEVQLHQLAPYSVR